MLRGLLLSSLVLNIGLLLGRLSGFIREAIVAKVYGVTAEADVVVLMLTVPDLLVNILMGGALSAVLIPEFSQHSDMSRRLLYQSILFFGIIFTGVAAIFYWHIDILVSFLAPGFSEEQSFFAAKAVGGVVWLIPLTIMAGATTAYLQSQNSYAIPALGTLIINSCIIIGLLSIDNESASLSFVAAFVLIGGVLRLLSQLLKAGLSWGPVEGLSPRMINKELLVHYGQAMLSGSTLLFFPVIARAIASFQEEGGVALFNYAVRLVEFPLALAVTFLTAVFFPRLSRSFKADLTEHRALIHYGVQITLALSIVTSVSLIIVSEDYTQIVYGYGGMGDRALVDLRNLTSIGLIVLPLQGLVVFLTAVFNSRKDTRTPLLLNLAGLMFFLLGSDQGLFGEGLMSLMWGMVASFGLIVLLQFCFLKVEGLNWINVMLDKDFVLGIIATLPPLVYFSHMIANYYFSPWISLALVALLAALSLVVLALFNKKLRCKAQVRLKRND